MVFSRALRMAANSRGLVPAGFGQLEGDVGGPVAVVPVLRPLDAHLIRDVGCGKRDFTGGDGVFQAGGYGEGEFFGSHSSSLPVAPQCGGIWPRHDGTADVRRTSRFSRLRLRMNHYAEVNVVMV